MLQLPRKELDEVKVTETTCNSNITTYLYIIIHLLRGHLPYCRHSPLYCKPM